MCVSCFLWVVYVLSGGSWFGVKVRGVLCFSVASIGFTFFFGGIPYISRIFMSFCGFDGLPGRFVVIRRFMGFSWV